MAGKLLVKKNIKITLNADDIKFVLSQYIKLYRGYGSIVIFNINNKRSYIESSKAAGTSAPATANVVTKQSLLIK